MDANTVERVRAFYESISPQRLGELEHLYDPNAYFRDPFNEVRGVAAIRAIFERMFEDLQDCRFTIVDTVATDRGAFLTWDFTFRVRRWRPRSQLSIHGASHLRANGNGRVVYHRDYWDAAEAIYEKVPLLGTAVRLVRKRLG